LPLPPTCRSASIRSALPHGLHLLDLAHWGLENEAQGEWPPRELSAVELPVGYLAGRSRLQWLLSKPNGPSPKEQEQTLLLELHTGKNAKQAAVAFLSTIYSHQQEDNLTLQSAASNLLPMREALGSESRDTAPCIGRDVISYLVNPFRDQIARAFHEE
jgi:hypothetical protein